MMNTTINSLERSRVEKAAVENGWEYIVESTDTAVKFEVVAFIYTAVKPLASAMGI